MAIQLPVPYLPGAPGSGLGDPAELADNAQQNFDALATSALPASAVSTFMRAILLDTTAAQVRAAIGAQADAQPACRVFNSAAIGTSNNTATYLTFDSEIFDTDTMHSTVTNTGRITFTTAGKYIFGADIEFASNSTGQRIVWVERNHSGVALVLTAQPPSSAGGAVMALSSLYDFAAGDYIEVVVQQSSGGNLNVTVGNDYSPRFWAARIGS